MSCLSFYGAYQYVRAVVVRAGRDEELLSQPVLSELDQEIMRQEYFLSPSTHPQSITHVGNSTGDIRIVNSKPAIAYLFRLHAGVANDSVKNYLAHVSFSGEAGYEALSYCWGDLGSHYRNVVDRGTPLIPVSLAAALIDYVQQTESELCGSMPSQNVLRIAYFGVSGKPAGSVHSTDFQVTYFKV